MDVKYFAPRTIGEACSLLSQYQEQAKVIAGGTDLVFQMKQGDILPKYIINIRGIPEQDYIIYDDKVGLSIGALATIHSIEDSPLIKEKFNVLAQAANKLGTPQIRNRATLAGNLCNAAPSADTIPALIVLDANLKILSTTAERTVSIENFFIGPGQTILKPDEIVIEIQVPNLPPQSSGVYIKHTIRKALDLAIVGVAVITTLDGEVLSNVRIALGTAAPTPLRAKGAEDILRGKKADEELIDKAAQTAVDESSPRDSVRSSAEYRRKMLRVLVAKAVRQAIEQVKAG